jgi:hypothetical protein
MAQLTHNNNIAFHLTAGTGWSINAEPLGMVQLGTENEQKINMTKGLIEPKIFGYCKILCESQKIK